MKLRIPVVSALIVASLFALISFSAPKASAQSLPPVAPGYLPIFSPYGYSGFPVTWTPWNAYTPWTASAGISFAYAPGSPQPDSCWLYDSWCSYCTLNSGSDLCMQMPPTHMATSSGPPTAAPAAPGMPGSAPASAPPGGGSSGGGSAPAGGGTSGGSSGTSGGGSSGGGSGSGGSGH